MNNFEPETPNTPTSVGAGAQAGSNLPPGSNGSPASQSSAAPATSAASPASSAATTSQVLPAASPASSAPLPNQKPPSLLQPNPNQPPAKTIDLQGVASFAALVELLAQELGTTAGRMLGHLPNGPTFNELVGEIDLNGQGFVRKLTLLGGPGAPLTLRFQCAWNDERNPRTTISGITADYYLGVTIEQVLPQGRAMARYVEDVFAVLDRMVTLGHSSKLSSMNVSAAELQVFEHTQGSALVRPLSERGGQGNK